MLTIVPEKIEAYCRDHSTPENPELRPLVQETLSSTEWPQMQVGHLEGNLLRLLVRLTGAKRVLELGTFTGYSALLMAEALPEDGKLITCDIDPEATAIAKKHWARFPHGRKIELRLGPALETIRGLSGPLDLVFIDADKESYIDYWDALVPKLRAGGLIVADNVLWSGKVLKPEDESDRAIAAFNERVRKDDRVEQVMLSVRDGMTLAVKR